MESSASAGAPAAPPRGQPPALGFARGVLAVAAVLGVLQGAVLLGGADLGPGSSDLAAARHFNNLLNRSLNQLLAIIFTAVAIAVPLTANLYSLKFLEFFVRDPVNAAVLLFVVFTNAANTMAGSGISEGSIPVAQLRLYYVLTMACFALLFPYLMYVFRFLHPNTLITRMERALLADFRAGARDPGRAGQTRRAASEGVGHIASIALRAIDRGDRLTAIESVLALERAARAYRGWKGALPASWFEADSETFPGFSSSALGQITASRCLLEMKIFEELRQVATSALSRMPSLVGTVARSLRRVGLEPGARVEPALRETVVDYLNTLLRAALNQRDARSTFIILDQYRQYAEVAGVEHEGTGRAVAYYFRYYGQLAREQRLPFVVEAAAHDLAALTRAAWLAGAPHREAFLGELLRYDDAAEPPLAGVLKAQAVLAGFFLQQGEDEAAGRIRRRFAGAPRRLVLEARDGILGTTRETYWEVNERRLNIDFVPEPLRRKVAAFFDGVLEGGAGPS